MFHTAIFFCYSLPCQAHIFRNDNVGIASYRHDYDNTNTQMKLKNDNASEFRIHRYQSPESIKNAFDHIRKRSSFKRYNDKDKRKGWVSCTKVSFSNHIFAKVCVYYCYVYSQ